jgi:hypothetical protein
MTTYETASKPSETVRSEPVRERKSAKEAYDDRQAGEIADVSPEGRPANPGLGAKGIAIMISASVTAVVIASILTAIFVSAAAGWGVFIVSMLLAVVINPVMYASILRAREREHTSHAG